MDLIKGIDVSHHNNDNGSINWDMVKKSGYLFAFVKLTEGTTFIDGYGIKNVFDAKKVGIAVGVYHFARFNNKEEALAEAQFFKNAIKANNLKLSYAVLDIEHPEAKGDLTDAALAFSDSLNEIAQPVVYSYPYFIKDHFHSSINKYPLWIAHYGVSSPWTPLWNDWQIWQQRSNGDVPGVSGNVDINVMKPDFFYGVDDNMIEKLVIASSDGDWNAASLAAYKYRCPVILKDVFENNKGNNQARQYIIIGGSENYNPGPSTIHLKGNDRIETAIEALS